MRTHLTCGAIALTMSTVALVAQTPAADVLICSGSFDGIYRLVDRDGDGKFLSPGEAYDYVLHGVDSSPRNVLIGNGPSGSTPRLYYTDTALDQVRWMWDGNGDGFIDSSEDHLAFDFSAYPIGGATSYPNFMSHGPKSAAGNETWYVVDSSGDAEGVFRFEDLNNDGDFMDIVSGIDEVTPVYVEGIQTQQLIGNTPNTTPAPALSFLGLQSIVFDPTYGKNGRILVEEEGRDFSVAFEDLDGDGDFDDPGEAYLFSNLWVSATSSLRLEANPDTVALLLPTASEVRAHAVDFFSGPPVYYMQSASSSSAPGIIFRGEDKNMDGDVNDAGEVTIFSDMGLASTGGLTGYNFHSGMVTYRGSLYVTTEFDGGPDNEHLVKLTDLNKDGDAEDIGESEVLWILPVDKAHYQPTVIARGFLPAAPSGLPGTYRYRGDATCPSSLNTAANPAPQLHNIAIGMDNWDDKFVIGKSTALRTWGSAASSIGVTNVALSELAMPLPLNPPTSDCNIYLLPLIGLSFTTDPEGLGANPLAIPNTANLIGLELYAQSAVFDAPTPTNPFGVTTSDYAWLRVGAYSYSVH